MSNRFPMSATGRIATDPAIVTGPSGQPRAEFRLAVDDRVRDENGHWSTKQTVFHDVVAWGHLAEATTAHLTKGDAVVVSGEIRYRTWITDDGSSRTASAIHADALGPDLRFNVVQIDRTRAADRARQTPAPSIAHASGAPTSVPAVVI